ncbi:N-acetylglucosamine-1-phosphotransferase subunits alpha/beta-like [Uloborus diversus]|uniref:N-acetylglucosamine-1-phosphotransferase subunits alpha/beta-like n=1 Tax=Uloborus diversus TaxID=327109 RepID=UPI002409D112|nr:N-acetylglucosamine-1-phosphotransferase subunits alpha/beta-like [Uloborus diversus]
MSRTVLCKLLQRKTYDILSRKHTVLLLFLGFIILFVSALHFGETLMEWSKEKYAVVFSPYHNNILGKSFRNMLCQYVPIDVVYTWVNGSDPKFLRELSKAKEEYGFSSSASNCTLSHCIMSHMILVRPQLPNLITLSDLEELNPAFEGISRIFVVASPYSSQDNITVLVFPDLQSDGQNYTLSAAFITDNWATPNTVLLKDVIIITDIPFGVLHPSEEIVFGKFPKDVQESLSKVHEDISASRFIDNEELRYSLRSLEKHAPWVQHVYIITNGQIPYWLNLDNPWITIVTHEEIFPNSSHLPTFSSPAIECHLHRIPHLSSKFLYLNDDVMFGKPVWPEDFYTHTKGQKVYLSWPVPNCAEGCPSSWIRDGYCDKPCNNSQCQWDGGDCSPDNPNIPLHGFGADQDGSVTHLFPAKPAKDYCNDDCANNWLADRYCDKACNIRQCGYDAGDCGLENFDKLYQINLLANKSFYFLPEVIGIVLYPNCNATNLTITIKGEYQEKPYEKVLALYVSTVKKPILDQSMTKKPSFQRATEESFTFESFQSNLRFPKINAFDNTSMEFGNVNISASQLPEIVLTELENLQSLLLSGALTSQGFLRRKSAIIGAYMNSLDAAKAKPILVYELHKPTTVPKHVGVISSTVSSKIDLIKKLKEDISDLKKNNLFKTVQNSEKIQENFPSIQKLGFDKVFQQQNFLSPSSQPLESTGKSNSATMSPSNLKSYFKLLGKPIHKPVNSSPTVTQRHLLDTFGDSLRHVNKLYNEAFGYEARKVPSHIAHFVDRRVMHRLTERFSTAFDVTSSHKIRSSNDMQFAFSYYYYLMSEIESVEINEIFDMFDTDNSGTWSDREIRTVLTRLHDLPLDFSTLTQFEQQINNCSSKKFTATHMPVPQNERYYDSKLPLVTKSLISSCAPVSDMLLQHFGHRKQNGYEVVGEEEVAFKMIHNNLSQVLEQIDDLRKNPKKFVCLNDNMNHGTQEADVIRAVIQDFYESLFPTRSQFELPPEYRNRFLYVSELNEWRKTRDIIRVVTYLSLASLIVFSLISFWKSEVRPTDRLARRRNLQARNRNPLHV